MSWSLIVAIKYQTSCRFELKPFFTFDRLCECLGNTKLFLWVPAVSIISGDLVYLGSDAMQESEESRGLAI